MSYFAGQVQIEFLKPGNKSSARFWTDSVDRTIRLISIRLIPGISRGLVLSTIPSSSHRVLSNFSTRLIPDDFASSRSLASSPNVSNENLPR